ncbi:MAG TPA: aldehyde dehydrogenase [Pseudogracilibacillus sp.]|nr:aldehyde dehydrogenase [Pseudogracilibacillus sp.]
MEELVLKQEQFFYTGETKSYEFRMKQLKKLREMISANESAIYQALYEDLNKSKHEALTTEIGILYGEIDFALKHLKTWMKDENVPTPLTHKGTSNYIRKEPYGVTLIIAPWNYPIQLAIAPLIGAIAAGNTVVLKPSELTPNCSNLLHDLFTQTFDERLIKVVEGGIEASQQLLAQAFDYIFFTGSTAVGKVVMQAASKHLTPVTLELGGKSPAIIDQDCQLTYSARRLVWGKLTNAGQTCVAPDYLFVHEAIKDKFIKQLKRQIRKMYRKDTLNNKDYVKIVNESHFQRLLGLIDEDKVVYGGNYDKENLKIEPTILDGVSWDDDVMEGEIFGPIFPILTFTDLNEVITHIRKHDKPLALYYFGETKKREQYVLDNTISGGVCINDTLYHLGNPYLPFGGVGPSGIGAYHGKYSFETFSHKRSVLKQPTTFDLPVRYPNSTLGKQVAKQVFK